jgi:hypothetical protein
LYGHIQKQIETTANQSHYDVIVLGVGSMGSSACYHLASPLPVFFTGKFCNQ